MVNFGLNSASLLGIFLAVAGAGLYLLRSVRPELSRDHDIFFAAIGLLCGFILLFQGWRLDPILQFGQFLLTGSTIFFAVESIRMRGFATSQAKQRTPIVDRERTVSDDYEYENYQGYAELEELEPVEERSARRRIGGTTDPRRNRTEDYEGEGRRRSTRRPGDERLGTGSRTRQDRRRPEARPPARSEDAWTERSEYDEWDDDSPNNSNEDWGDASGGVVRKPRRPRPGGPSSAAESIPDTPSRSRTKRTRPRPPQDPVSEREVYAARDIPPSAAETTPTDYVDYQPIDRSDEEGDNSGNFDR